jgi:MoxR-like ATPase
MSTVPDLPESFEAGYDPEYDALGSSLGDRRDGRIYVFDRSVRLAVRVAVASGRPLLLRGPAGAGKSSLAPFVARQWRWRYYWTTVTARTEARDLMWHFDALRRLNDAQIQAEAVRQRVNQLQSYIIPGVLWWAFNPISAARRGLPQAQTLLTDEARDPGIGIRQNGVVVLIDEIDKADPDVPNNLLEALGSLQFTVQETGDVVTAAAPPLVIITTNDERELPGAFQRRCVVLELQEHTPEQLATIATHHFRHFVQSANSTLSRNDVYQAVAQRLTALQVEARSEGQRVPSTAEYLDAIRACLALDIDPRDPGGDWPRIERLTLLKRGASDAPTAAAPAAAPGVAAP